MNKSLISSALLASTFVAAESPKVEGFAGQDPWAYVDFTFGIILGAYNRVQIQVHDRNCYSTVFNLAVNNISKSRTFDTGIANTDSWYGYPLFIAEMAFAALEGVQVIGGCQQEYVQALNTKWYTHYEFSGYEPAYKPEIFDDDWVYEAPDALDTWEEEVAEALDGEDKEEGEESKERKLPKWLEWTQSSEFRLVMDVTSFVFNIFGVYETIQATDYYFFFSGMNIGAVLVDSTVLLDSYLNFLDITPMPQWKRYKGIPIV